MVVTKQQILISLLNIESLKADIKRALDTMPLGEHDHAVISLLNDARRDEFIELERLTEEIVVRKSLEV